MHLVVDQYGVFLGKKSERLVVRDQNKVTQEVPLRQLEQITVAGGAFPFPRTSSGSASNGAFRSTF